MKTKILQIIPAPTGSFVLTYSPTRFTPPWIEEAACLALIEFDHTDDEGDVFRDIVPLGMNLEYSPHFDAKDLYASREEAEENLKNHMREFNEGEGANE